MRLYRFQAGRFRHLPLPATSGCMHQVDVETLLRQNMHTDGTISSLCLDFCGSYVALQHEDEIRLAARLLCTYHNSLLPGGPGASLSESPPAGPECTESGPEHTESGPEHTAPPTGPHPSPDLWTTQISRFGGRRARRHSAGVADTPQKRGHIGRAAEFCAVDEYGLPLVDEFGQPLPGGAGDAGGRSDSDDEKDRSARLAWEYEVNADVDGTPCFGKAKMESRLW